MLDSAIKFGAGRYRQDRNILKECGQEIRRFGKKAFVIAGPRAFDAVKEQLLLGFEAAGLDYVVEIYSGPCSFEAAGEYAGKCLDILIVAMVRIYLMKMPMTIYREVA